MRYSIRHTISDAQRCCNTDKQQQGVALITAVLVAAMVTATAVTMATTHRFSMQRGFNQLNGTLADLGVKALESDISRALVKDISLSTVDSLDEDWAIAQWAGDYVNTSTTAQVTDLQALFNLQNLGAQFGARSFRNPSTTAETAADSVKERFNPGSNSDGDSVADSPLSTPTSLASDSNLSDEQTPKETFDRSKHQEFIDSYVESCVEENQQCAREAVALAYKQAQAANPEPFADVAGSNAEDNDDPNSSMNPLANREHQAAARVPDGRTGGAAQTTKSDTKGDDPIDSEAQLSALFRALDLDLEPVQAILDWIDQDSETRYPNGAEDEYYTGLQAPYRAANSPFVTIRELLLVRGVTIEIYEKLAPLLSVLPQATPININTASAHVLMAIHPMIDRSTAELLIDARKAQPFQTIKAFVEHPALLGLSIPTGLLSTKSDYFQINTILSSDTLQTHHQTLLKRSNSEAVVVRRSRGYFN